MIKRALTLALALTGVAFVPSLQAQSVQFDLGLGAQWYEVTGNTDLYRTHTGANNDGFLLDTFGLVVSGGKDGLFDRLQIDASGIGASPDSRFRFRVERAKLFDVNLSYTRSDIFSAYPDYANPFLASGVIPGQHTLDRKRDAFDLDVTLLPGGTISPIVGYSRYHYWGPGTSTLTLGQDQFALTNDIDQTIDEYRIGAGVALGTWRATVLQGWQQLDSSYDYALASGANGGNFSIPVLGVDVKASQLGGHSSTTGTTPYTNLQVTGRLFDRVRVVGSYARTSNAGADTDETFSAAGQFVSFAISRYFLGASETDATSAKATNWRGEARFEVDITSWLDLVAGYTSSSRELSGEAMLNTVYVGTTNFSGLDPKNVATVVSATTAWDRQEDVAEAKINARPADWLRLWVGGSWIDQDVNIAPAAAEVVVPGGQGGSYERSIDRLSAGADVTAGPFTIQVDWLTDDADQAVVRTDYLDRDRLRGRLGLKVGKWVKLLGTAEKTQLENPTVGIEYQGDIEHWAADLDITPIEALTIHGGYDSYESDSQMLIRIPQDFTTETETYLEDAENVEGSVAFKLGRFMLEGGENQYKNEGSLPFELKRSYARFDISVNDVLGFYGQFEKRRYTDKQLSSADYDADRYTLCIRWASK